jgi:hypothetical protein
MLVALWGHLSYFIRDFSIYLALIIISFFALAGTLYFVFKVKEKKFVHKIILGLTFWIFLFVIVFSAFEGYFRYIYDKTDTLGFLKVNQKWMQRHVTYTTYKQYYFRTKPFNSEKPPPGTIRIGVMGDSLAFGAGIKDPANRFSDLLEKKLNDSGVKVQVINFAIPGYDTNGEIETYNGVKDLHFDILVWSYFLNDIEDQFNSPGTAILAKNSQRARVLEAMSNFSYFFDYIYWRITSTHQTTINELGQADLNAYRNPDQLSKHYSDITNFLSELKSDHVVPVTIIFPYFALIGPNYPAYDIHQTMDKVFGDNGVATVDLIGDLKDKDARSLWASNFDPHPNEYVNRLAADRLFDKIVPIIKSIEGD